MCATGINFVLDLHFNNLALFVFSYLASNGSMAWAVASASATSKAASDPKTLGSTRGQ
jgi:hypothetical protein